MRKQAAEEKEQYFPMEQAAPPQVAAQIPEPGAERGGAGQDMCLGPPKGLNLAQPRTMYPSQIIHKWKISIMKYTLHISLQPQQILNWSLTLQDLRCHEHKLWRHGAPTIVHLY